MNNFLIRTLQSSLWMSPFAMSSNAEILGAFFLIRIQG